VRDHTVNRYGPVREVHPRLVSEIALRLACTAQKRHKSGWRCASPGSTHPLGQAVPEADTLESLAADDVAAKAFRSAYILPRSGKDGGDDNDDSRVYDALVAAGSPEEQGPSGCRRIAAYENRFGKNRSGPQSLK